MVISYKILRPVTPADLDVNTRFAESLRTIPPEGHITRDHFKSLNANDSNRCMRYAISSGILRKIMLYEHVSNLKSVKYWCTQLNKPGHTRTSPKSSTMRVYLGAVAKLNEWLPGRQFPSHKTVICDGQIIKQPIIKSFANVEELMHYGTESDHGTKAVQRAIREYLTSTQADKMSDSVHVGARAAIKSYFSTNDVVLELPKNRKKQAGIVSDDDSMSLEDFYNILKDGNPELCFLIISSYA